MLYVFFLVFGVLSFAMVHFYYRAYADYLQQKKELLRQKKGSPSGRP